MTEPPVGRRWRRDVWRLSWRKGALTILLTSGCTVELRGLVESSGQGAVLQTMDGQRVRLALGPEQRGIEHLHGADVQVEGIQSFGRIQVSKWTTGDGPQGWPTWLGRLESKGVQLGLQDRNSGAYYLLDQSVTDPLGAYVGELVMVEGYVNGAHRVKVLQAQVLTGASVE